MKTVVDKTDVLVRKGRKESASLENKNKKQWIGHSLWHRHEVLLLTVLEGCMVGRIQQG